MTDGAVWNTQDIVNLINKKALASNTRVHTFGIGSGASTELVKNAALAGCGSYYFIYDNSQIEEKVVLAMQKNYAPVLKVHNIRALDSNGQELEGIFKENQELFEQ